MTAFAAPGDTFNDVDGHWGQSAIERWSEYGVVNGDGTGGFAPDKQMTRAEFATMLANMLGYKDKAANTFADVNDSDWFADAILKLAAAGVIQGSNGMANPNAPISRQEAAVMMCRAFNIPTTGGNLDFADSADVADWAKGAVAALADRGMMNGVGNNNVAPLADINRASVATLLDNMITEYVTEDKTITGEVSGIVLVAADATVTVEDATLNENLIVAPKADGAEVTLTGNTTASDVVVDAAATVKVDSNATAGEVQATTSAAVTVAGKVDAVGGDASVSVTETGKVDNVAGSDVTVEKGAAVKDVAADKVTVAQGASVESVVCNNVTVEKDASVGSLTLTDASAKAEVSGTVKNVTVQENATGATVNTNSGATVGKVETAAKDVTVSGNGKVENVTATGGTANVTTPGTNVENKTDNKDNVTNNGKPVEPSTGGDTPTPTPPSGGGSSGGGSTPATTYAVNIDPEITNGTVTATPSPAAEGATVTLTITPATGYEVGTITVKDADDGVVTVTDNKFVMPAKAVTVTVTFTPKTPTLTVAAKTGDWNGKADTDLQKNLIVTQNGTTVTVSGVSNKITENWDAFSSVDAEKTGCYIWLEYTLDKGGYNDAYVTIKSGDNNKTVIAAGSEKEDVISRIADSDGTNKKSTLEVTIHYNTNQTSLYTVNLNNITCAGVNDVIVTFDSNGGTPVAPVVVSQNGDKKVTAPSTTRTGYTLDGWYKEAGFTNKVDFSAETVTASTTYYARWTADEYTVTYDVNGGTEIENGKYTVENAFTLPTPATRPGYTFDGWYAAADFSGDKVTQIAKGSTGNKSFHAKWTSNTTFTAMVADVYELYKNDEAFGTGIPDLAEFQENVTFEATGTNVAVKGTLLPITNPVYAGFNQANAGEQTGYYMVFQFEAPDSAKDASGNIVTTAKKAFTKDALDPVGEKQIFSFIWWIDEPKDTDTPLTGKKIEITVDWDGDGNSQATKYTLDLSGVTLQATTSTNDPTA